MPKNWKYIKKQLEKEFLCEKLIGHITYDLTNYRPAPWYQQHFIMKCDDEVLLDASQPDHRWYANYQQPPSSTYWASNMIADRLYDKYELGEYEVPRSKVEAFTASIIHEMMAHISHYDGVYGVKEIIDAIGIYLHSDIKKNLKSEEFFILALAVLDRRCGKRTLEEFAKWDYVSFPHWLRNIYRVRFEAEGIKYSKAYFTKEGEQL